MKISTAVALFSLLIVFSCKKEDESKMSPLCKSLFDQLNGKKVSKSKVSSTQYIANGCEDITGNVPGEKSTANIWLGTGSCTGIVVSNHFLVTASHCLFNRKTNIFTKVSDTEIVVGDNGFQLDKIKIIKAEKIFVNRIYIDRNFIGSSLGDIGLIKTKESLVNYGFIPIKITRIVVPNENIWSVGYGSTGKFHKGTSGLKRWTLSLVLNGVPNLSPKYIDLYRTSYLLYPNEVDLSNYNSPENTFLINKRQEGYHGQTCYGDSGGPHFVRRNGEIVAIAATQGANSFLLGKEAEDIFDAKGDDCNELSTSVNTLIAPYLKWLNMQMLPFGEQIVSVD